MNNIFDENEIKENNIYAEDNLAQYIRTARRFKEHIYCSQKIHFKYTQEGQRIGIFGRSGTGKTYLADIIFMQYPAGIYLDPQHAAYENLKHMLKDQPHLQFPDYYIITPRNIKEKLLINVRDIDISFIKIMFAAKKDDKARQKLNQFFSLPPYIRTYDNLKKFCLMKKNKLENFWDDIRIILHKKDEGMPIEEFEKKKVILNYAELGPQSVIPIAIIATIFANRLKYGKYRKRPYLIAVDEVQTNAPANSALGLMLKQTFSRGRFLGISSMAIGTNAGDLPPATKSNVTHLFLFHTSRSEVEKFKGLYGLDLITDDFENYITNPDIEKGWSFYFNLDSGLITGNSKNAFRANSFGLMNEEKFIKEVKELDDFTKGINAFS